MIKTWFNSQFNKSIPVTNPTRKARNFEEVMYVFDIELDNASFKPENLYGLSRNHYLLMSPDEYVLMYNLCKYNRVPYDTLREGLNKNHPWDDGFIYQYIGYEYRGIPIRASRGFLLLSDNRLHRYENDSNKTR